MSQPTPWIETPLIESAALSKTAGCRVFLKLELLQPSGSFKSRGIGNFIRTAAQHPPSSKTLHFFISSGGNAGLAAVIAAQDLGHPCSVVVPHSTKPMMIEKLRNVGATQVIQHGSSWFEADSYLRETFIEKQTGDEAVQNVYIPPFDHPDVWAGAGTMIPEIVRQLPARECGFPADAVVCSVGGGGLFNGIVGGIEEYLQTSQSQKDVHVLAVETEGAHSLAHSLRQGSMQSLSAITSQATSLGALRVSPRTFESAQSPPQGIKVSSVVCSDLEAEQGVVCLADEARLQVELACGVSVYASTVKLREILPDLTPESRVVLVVCGGSNISAEMIAEYRGRMGV